MGNARQVDLPTFTPITGALRALAMDAVEKAKSGHPGAPMGMAEIAAVLWRQYLRHNPANPQWPNRDRFVLSNGHGSMLIYALLHLTGYELSIDDLKNFRQLHSKTPGHPEYGYTPGVETTTGPLGQGIANAVGMALAEKVLASEFNTATHTIVDHHTYAFLGDGCLMEGISHEVCSLAGTLGLGKLIAFYDDNNISIDGHVEGWFTDDTPKRFEAYGWQVINVQGHDEAAIAAAVDKARAETGKPTLICCKTIIGAGAPNKQGGHDVHGAALGEAELTAARTYINWPHPPFVIPPEVYAAWDARTAGAEAEAAWQKKFAAYQSAQPEKAAEFLRRQQGNLPSNWDTHVAAALLKVEEVKAKIASRKASQNSIEALAPVLPELIGGSADLASSNLTLWSGSKTVSATNGGNYLHYGVREFGMCAIANGLSLYGALVPYTATFLMFSDYARSAIRMAALMKLQQIFVFTHDSIGLGEDGPTHQPVEHANSLRIIPNLDTWRPADATETLLAWVMAIERKDGPSALLLSRQNLPYVPRSSTQIAQIRQGAYIVSAGQGKAQAQIIATGSELTLALAAQQQLAKEGITVNIISMPCAELFARQTPVYRQSIINNALPSVAVEAGQRDWWYKYVGLDGAVIGIDQFGESAPAEQLFNHFGITSAAVTDAVRVRVTGK